MQMEEYLKNMRSLRSHMNDIEEEAAKRSVEEQKQRTAIDALEKDLDLVKAETRRANEEAEETARDRAQVCCHIVEKHKQNTSLEAESGTLSQTLDLLQREMVGLSAKLEENRTFYEKILEDLNTKLQDQQDWFNSYKQKIASDVESIQEPTEKEMDFTEGKLSEETLSAEVNAGNMGHATSTSYKHLVAQISLREAELEKLIAKKSELLMANNKTKQMMEQLTYKLNSIPPELNAMDDNNALEEEHKALLGDKAAETEYLLSLQDKIQQLEGISDVVKCQCGAEYKVHLME